MIVVTGGAGFIGSNIVRGLNDAGEENILVVDNLSNAQKHLNLNKLSFTDYMDKNDFLVRLREITDIRVIFHQGACSSTTEQDGKYMMSNNYEYSKILLNHCLEHKIDFLYASSAAVYGNGDNGFAEEPKAEYPLNVYGFSKFAFDNYVRRVLPEAEIQILGLRYFNVYGPYQDPNSEYSAVIPIFIKNALKNKTITIFGDGQTTRDFVFVDDVVQANLQAALYSESDGFVINIAYGKSVTLTKLAEYIINKTKSDSGIVYEPFRKGDVLESLADLSQAKKLLKYNPQFDLLSGLEKTIQFFAQ